MNSSTPTNSRQHWEQVYRDSASDRVSWYRQHLDLSMQLLQRAGLCPESRVLDVGGGASTLVDDLLASGVVRVSVLDLSAAALMAARQRLGENAAHVAWLAGDITRMPLTAAAYTHWHDRAVLHFLTDEAQTRAYAAQAQRAIAAGGHAIIGGFAPDGPERCSGLAVARRSADDVAALLGPAFELIDAQHETHQTPAGGQQVFVYALLRRRAG